MIDWKKYKKNFVSKAEKLEISSKKIEKFLNYANNLNKSNLPIIFDFFHFSRLVGYTENYILGATNFPEFFYREFKIKKKSNGYRKINEPLPSLKEIQKWILKNILYKLKVSRFSKAFIPGNTIKDNAKFHKGQRIVLTIDLKDFFNSIKFIEIYRIFRKAGYTNSISVLLSKLSTLNDSLPQGSPTSPYLSNLVFNSLDNRISGFCTKRKIRYTRYADDLTFSGDFSTGMVIKFVKKIIKSKNLCINNKKLRTMYQYKRQEVTGIVVNEKLQTARTFRKELRKDIYYIKKYGIESHIEKKKIHKANYINHLLGKINFILFVNPNDNEARANFNFLKEHLKIQQ
jgi:RNA-directed DNA polymerase